MAPSPPSGPLTRARAKALQEKVTSLLSTFHLGTPLDGMLLTADTLCVVRYIPQETPPGSPTSEAERRREENGAAAPAEGGTTAHTPAALPLGGTTGLQEDITRTSENTSGKSTRKGGTTAA